MSYYYFPPLSFRAVTELVCGLPISDRTKFNPGRQVSDPQFSSAVILVVKNISFCSRAFQKEPIFKAIIIKYLFKPGKGTTSLKIIQAFQFASGGERRFRVIPAELTGGEPAGAGDRDEILAQLRALLLRSGDRVYPKHRADPRVATQPRYPLANMAARSIYTGENNDQNQKRDVNNCCKTLQ